MAAVDVVNDALRKIGQGTITTLTDGSTTAAIANALYAGVFQEVQRQHDWRALRRRLTPVYTTTTLAFTGGALGADTATAAAAHFTADDVGRVLYEVDANGADKTGVSAITAYTSTTVVTVNTTVVWDDTTPAANRWRLSPHQGWARNWTYEFAMPTGWLTVREAAWGFDFAVEAGRILSNTPYGSLKIAGTVYSVDDTAWDALMRQATVARMAAILAEPITHDPKIVGRCNEEYDYLMGLARARDDQHGTPDTYLPTFINRGR